MSVDPKLIEQDLREQSIQAAERINGTREKYKLSSAEFDAATFVGRRLISIAGMLAEHIVPRERLAMVASAAVELAAEGVSGVFRDVQAHGLDAVNKHAPYRD